MKVLLLTTHLNIGGVGLYVLNLAKGLKKRGIDCFVASSGGELVQHLEPIQIPHILLNIKTKCEFNPMLIASMVNLIKFIKRNNIDIIHSQTRVTQVLGEALSKIMKIHFVATCHGFFKSRRVSRVILPCWGEKTIAISDAVRAHLINDFNLPPENVVLIYNGVDFENYSKVLASDEKEILKNQLRLKNGPVIGSIGRFSPVKGFKFLLFALKDLKRDFPDLNLLLIGEGPSYGELKDLSKEFGLEHSVFFVKPKLDTWRYLSIMDIFVFPSLQEGLGLSLLEAMASGRACIATSIGGISSVIIDNKNGLLVPPEDAGALADAIRKLLLDKNLLTELQKKAQERILDRFSLDKMVDETIAFYKDVRGYQDIRESV